MGSVGRTSIPNESSCCFFADFDVGDFGSVACERMEVSPA